MMGGCKSPSSRASSKRKPSASSTRTFRTHHTQLSFEMKVCGVGMLINPDRVSMLLEIACPLADAVIFPNQGIDKAHISKLFEREGISWTRKTPTKKCYMVARVLDIILVHNLLQTTHKTDMLDDRVNLVTILMEGKSIDVPAIMCYTMLHTSIEDDTKRGLPYIVLVT